MLLDLVALMQSSQRVECLAFRDLVEVPEDVGLLISPIVGGLKAEVNTAREFLFLKGEFQSSLRLICHRCANPFHKDLNFEVDETLEIVGDAPSSVEVGTVVWEKGPVDITDLVRQNLLLALPSQFHCGCEPLTPISTPMIDPRWQKLSSFQSTPPATEET